MTTLTVKGFHRAAAKRYLPPDTNGLLYWGMYGVDLDLTRKNHKDGSVVTVVGSPVYSPNYVQFTQQSAYINTGVAQSNDHTFIAVVKVDALQNTGLISNYNSPTSSGTPPSARGVSLDLVVQSGITDRMNITMNCSVNVSGVDTSAGATVGGYMLGQWACLAGRVNSTTGERKVFHLTANTNNVATNANPVNKGTGLIRVGSPIVGNSGSELMGMAAIYNVAKTDAEIQAIYQKMKALYAYYGITI